jgi:hypothetical protein
MTAVVVLISHDHDMAVTKTSGVGVHLLMLQTKKSFDVLDFGIL